MKTIRFVIPNGSLSTKLIQYLEIAGYHINSPDRCGFCGKVNGIEFYQLDRRMVPLFLENGFEAGITGYDLFLASGVKNLLSVAELTFARKTEQSSRWVLVRRKGITKIPGTIKIACELPDLARILIEKVEENSLQSELTGDDSYLMLKIRKGYSKFIRIDGSEEQVVSSGLADMALLVTETGTSINANGLEIFPGCENLLVSTPRVLSRSDLEVDQNEKLQALVCALQAVIGAKTYVMVSFDIGMEVEIEKLNLPSSVAPTVSPLTDPEWKAGEICIPRSDFGEVTRKLRKAGAKSIGMRDIQGYMQ